MQQDSSRPQVAVIGAGPAGLMAAEVLAHGGVAVTVYERMPTAGRKFLLAGRGGLNLTHGEPFECLLARYGAAARRLRAALEAFSPSALRAWSENLGQPTFVGSSGRIFPTAFKASPLLRAWLKRLDATGVKFELRHRWLGWDSDRRLIVSGPRGRVAVLADATVLALGGASWPRLGSDGSWVEPLRGAGVEVAPLAPSNCGFTVDWSDIFRSRFEGKPLKRIALSFAEHVVRGEGIVTRGGLEGGAVYALSGPLREALSACGAATLHIDLRPDFTAAALAERLRMPRGKQSLATFLRKSVALPPEAVGLLHEASIATSRPLTTLSPDALAHLMKAVPVTLTGTAPLANAISTAGGIAWSGTDDCFMLRRRPGVFVAGEMLDFDAPTGGYLMQAAFATGAAAARGALTWLSEGAMAC